MGVLCLLLSLGLESSLASVAAVVVAVLLVHADLLFSPDATLWTAAVFFGDADVLARVAVVLTGSSLLRSLAFPSSVLDSYFLLSLDLEGLFGLVPVR